MFVCVALLLCLRCFAVVVYLFVLIIRLFDLQQVAWRQGGGAAHGELEHRIPIEYLSLAAVGDCAARPRCSERLLRGSDVALDTRSGWLTTALTNLAAMISASFACCCYVSSCVCLTGFLVSFSSFVFVYFSARCVCVGSWLQLPAGWGRTFLFSRSPGCGSPWKKPMSRSWVRKTSKPTIITSYNVT